MDIHLQYPPGLNSLQSPDKPSVGHAASVESTYQGKQVTEYQGESPSLKEEKPGLGTRAWSSIKSIPREISIFCRAVGKVSLVAYYLVKHTLFGRELTSEHLQNYLTRLGPAYSKLLQMLVGYPDLLEQLCNALNSTESEREKFDGVIRNVLDNNPEIPMSVPRSILDKAGSKDLSVERHIATGTIGSCFEVKKDEESLVAKVVPHWKANDLAAGLKSIRIMLRFLPKDIRMTIREMTDPYIQECNLKQEKKNQTVFKETLEKTTQTEIIENRLMDKPVTLTFKVAKISEAVNTENLLIMEHINGGHTLNELMNPANEQLRAELYQTCFGQPPLLDCYSKFTLAVVHSQIKAKWRELALKHGIVHGDCHTGNIMLSCKSDHQIDVWFIDFGNCVTLTPAQRTQFPDIVGLLSHLANPFGPEALDQTGIDRLVDILWDEVAISHRANTPENKEKFKNRLIEDLNEFRDLDLLIGRIRALRSMSPEQELEFREDLRDPDFQEDLKIQVLSLVSARLNSSCVQLGIQLPSSFTRYISAHLRAGVILEKQDC